MDFENGVNVGSLNM